MKFVAEIEILPLKGLLDPQGKAVANGLPKIGIETASNVRIGKFITPHHGRLQHPNHSSIIS
ncbi:MAG: hypothetical protein RLZZ47_403 [Bacteroidota bacterium]